jgi:type I restriction enzyme S subunit
VITVRWADDDVAFPQVEFRRLFRPLKREVPPEAAMVTAYTDGAVTLRSNRLREGGYHEAIDMSGMQGVHKGDFVVHGLDILRGSVGISDSTGAISSVCVLCEPTAQADPRYFAWVIRAQAFSGFPRALARGVREGGADFRRWDTLAELPVPAPPISVQTTIANYLDAKTSGIDTLIARKQRMIELLGQRLNSAIEEELLGCTPLMIPLRRLLLALPQYGASETGGIGEDHWPRYIRITDLDSEGQLRMDQVLRLPPEVAAPYLLHEGDVLIARSGGTVGKAFRYTSKLGAACFAGYLIRFRFDSTMVDSRIVESWTKTQHYWSQVYGSALQATIQNVSAQQYLNLLVPVPSLEDQQRLVNDFSQITTDVKRLIEINERQICLFQEHRQALIAAAVTGQLDLSEVAT